MEHFTNNNDIHTNNENESAMNKQSNFVSYQEGYNFIFEVEGHLIRVHGSAVTGKECVYVDDELITEKRSFGRRSCLSFTIDGAQYDAEFYVANILTGETHCSLIKEGVHVETLKKALKKSQQLNIKNLIPPVLYGALAGVAFSIIYFVFSE